MMSFEVALLSGRSACIEVPVDCTLGTLRDMAQDALAVLHPCRLCHEDGRVCSVAAKVATLPRFLGFLVAPPSITASSEAFAACLGDGSVETWGAANMGGSSEFLHDVTQLQSTCCSFAALLCDGSVVTWGDPIRGGDSSVVQEQLFDVRHIQASRISFAALRGDG